MGLTVQNGSLVVSDGKLGTGQGCCCPSCSCVDWCCAAPQVTIAEQQLPYKTFAEWIAGPKPCNCLFDVTCAGSSAQFYGELSLDGSYDNDKFVFLNINFNCSNGVSTVQVEVSDGGTGIGTVPGVIYGIATAVVNFNCSGGALSFSNWQWTYCASEACDGAPVGFEFASTFPCNPLP